MDDGNPLRIPLRGYADNRSRWPALWGALQERSGVRQPAWGDPKVLAEEAIQTVLHACADDSLLEEAIKKMIMTDIQRVLIHKGDRITIVVGLSLSYAALGSSGSCHACVSSRIKVEEQLTISSHYLNKKLTWFS